MARIADTFDDSELQGNKRFSDNYVAEIYSQSLFSCQITAAVMELTQSCIILTMLL
jgi:hypothetical protein